MLIKLWHSRSLNTNKWIYHSNIYFTLSGSYTVPCNFFICCCHFMYFGNLNIHFLYFTPSLYEKYLLNKFRHFQVNIQFLLLYPSTSKLYTSRSPHYQTVIISNMLTPNLSLCMWNVCTSFCLAWRYNIHHFSYLNFQFLPFWESEKFSSLIGVYPKLRGLTSLFEKKKCKTSVLYHYVDLSTMMLSVTSPFAVIIFWISLPFLYDKYVLRNFRHFEVNIQFLLLYPSTSQLYIPQSPHAY